MPITPSPAAQTPSDTSAPEAGSRPDAVRPDHRAVRKIERGDVRVGRDLVVVVEELAAAGADADRRVQVQEPADDVEGVDAVVADLGGAVIPVPVPVVVEAIG